MNINLNELDHITQQLVDAKTQLLQERIRRLEQENAELSSNLKSARALLPNSVAMHNHFESGSKSQVFNDKVIGSFETD